MITWKIWHDVRQRFYGSLFFILAIAILHVALFPLMKGFFNWAEVDYNEWPDLKLLLENFVRYTDLRWFQEIERNTFFGVILTLGGILTEARQRTILLTLSLPVRRRTWLVVQFGLVLGLLLALNLIALPVLIAGGFIHGQSIGIGHLLAGAFLLTLTAAPYIGMTILFTSITGETIRALLYSLAFLVFTNQLDRFATVDPWMPETLMFVLTDSFFPWQAILSIVLISAASLTAAILRFEKTDY